ncbi:GNAT family N-acetyltransferase [Culicoidibacter larvae]|uniref:GNAT family N-acetyltransferase n=1 Tax=Culicoidibacter larvae TaxID=2579976 RepID=A0A5R8QAK7_9FIRM|nr:GNAT family N-acetyltransferase [Culicoidibacter larvae]TLG72146.1 GNAT family N-acetyltransferase [Culicoidibacter larvae]
MKAEVFKGYKHPFIDDAFYVRDEVFTKEQGYPKEIDIDEYDNDAIHAVLYTENNQPIGTARMIINEAGDAAKIGRVAIVKAERGKDYGLLVMQKLIDYAHANNIFVITLHAQTHAQGFYEKLDFEVIGEGFMEDGAAHIRMDHRHEK